MARGNVGKDAGSAFAASLTDADAGVGLRTDPLVPAAAGPRRRVPSILAALANARADRLMFGLGALTVLLVVAGQVVEDIIDGAGMQLLPPTLLRARWTVIAVSIYLIVSVEIVRRVARRELEDLRPVVHVDDAMFAACHERMTGFHPAIEVRLLAASFAVVVLLFLVLGAPLPTANDPITRADLHMPAAPAAALVIVLGYTALGWAGLRLVEKTVRLGRVLGRLSREPVTISVFDTSNLLPFGNIALAAALAPAGLIAILLLGLGAPTTPVGWTVLLLATSATMLALMLPLRGIHRQMRGAKDDALAGLNRQLSEVHAQVGPRTMSGGAPVAPGDPTTGELNDRASLLVSLRRVVGEMPTWPFRDTVAFGRAVLIASAPLIYTVLSELIKVFFINPLSA